MTTDPVGFDDRHSLGAAWEVTVRKRLEQRGWEVTLTGCEHHYSPASLEILRRRRANLAGPDMVATMEPGLAYAIDAKTTMACADGVQHFLPGMGQFTISERALRAMEAFTGGCHIPSLFVLDDGDAGMAIPPIQVRRMGVCNKAGGFWYICSVHCKPLRRYFGDLPAGEEEYRWAGEHPGDFPLAG
jgi:hypothetical protein